MTRQGFDNQKYLTMQSQHIQERIAQFGGKLYLEFSGEYFERLSRQPGAAWL